jgi:hypothetical protein
MSYYTFEQQDSPEELQAFQFTALLAVPEQRVTLILAADR